MNSAPQIRALSVSRLSNEVLRRNTGSLLNKLVLNWFSPLTSSFDHLESYYNNPIRGNPVPLPVALQAKIDFLCIVGRAQKFLLILHPGSFFKISINALSPDSSTGLEVFADFDTLLSKGLKFENCRGFTKCLKMYFQLVLIKLRGMVTPDTSVQTDTIIEDFKKHCSGCGREHSMEFLMYMYSDHHLRNEPWNGCIAISNGQNDICYFLR